MTIKNICGKIKFFTGLITVLSFMIFIIGIFLKKEIMLIGILLTASSIFLYFSTMCIILFMESGKEKDLKKEGDGYTNT